MWGRREATEDPEGKIVKVKWARANKGIAQHLETRCWAAAQEPGFEERDCRRKAQLA